MIQVVDFVHTKNIFPFVMYDEPFSRYIYEVQHIKPMLYSFPELLRGKIQDAFFILPC